MRFKPWFFRCLCSWLTVTLLRLYLPLLAPSSNLLFGICYILVAIYAVIQGFIVAAAVGNVLKKGVHGGVVDLVGKPYNLPKLRIIVVTWGTRPDLINEIMNQNVSLFFDAGFHNIHFEVYANKELVELGNIPSITQTSYLVPEDYEAPHGLIGKARNLAYAQSVVANEDPANTSPFVLVLDQDVRLTSSAVAGILNFMMDGARDFANGYSYVFSNRNVASKRVAVMNDLTYTVALNSADFLTSSLHWRYPHTSSGGYQISKVEVFRSTPYGNSLTRGLGEDIYFDYTASSKGFVHGFLQGHALRGTPAEYSENLSQKERWARCMVLIVASSDLPWRGRLVQFLAMSSWYLGGWVFLWVMAFPEITANPILPFVLSFGLFATLTIHILEARKIEGIGFREILWRSFVCLFSSPYWSFQLTFGTSFRLACKLLTGSFYAWPEKRS